MTGLDQKVASAARWSLINTVVIRVGTFATGAIVARFFLGPDEWGLYAVGLVALAVLLSMNEMGVSLAIVRWDGDVRRFAPTVLSLSAMSSSTLYAALFFAAPWVAEALGSAEATPVLRVLGLVVIIDGIGCVPMGVLTREFQQRKRTLVDFADFVVYTTVTITLAALGLGALSIACGAVAGRATAAIGYSIAAPGMLRFGWDPRQAKELVRFGLPLAGASLLVLAVLNADSALVGALLGPTALGLYQIAYTMAAWPVRAVSDTARRVTFAGFSRLAEDPARLANGFRRGLALLLTASTPACVLLGVLAEPVVRLIYGPDWTPAAAALRFLVVVGILRIVAELTYDCLVAAGRRKVLLLLQGWWLVVLVPALVLGSRWGIGGVASANAAVVAILVMPALVVALARIGVTPGSLLRAAARPALGGALMGVVCWLIVRVAGDGLLGVGLAGLVALAVYAPFALPLLRFARVGTRAGSDDPPAEADPAEAGVVEAGVVEAGRLAPVAPPTEGAVGRHRREDPAPPSPR